MASSRRHALTQRRAICLDCRTALDPGETCDGGKRHRVVSLEAAEGREQLLREVWGPPGLRRKVRKLAAAGGGGAAAGAALEGGCELCSLLECATSAGEFVPAVLVILAAAAAAILIYLLVSYIVRTVRQRRHRIKPNGALKPPMPPRGRRHAGTIAADAATIPGLNGAMVAAHGLRLTSKRFLGSSVMLLDGVSAGFNLTLTDGSSVRIPAGRIRVQGPVGRGEPVAHGRVQDYLAELDPLRKQVESLEDLDPVPFDEALELTLKPGDSVELVGQLELVPDMTAPTAGYREAAASRFELRGSVLLRPGTPPR